jgi:hypothetical protein
MILMTDTEHATEGTDQPFEGWLSEKIEEARYRYEYPVSMYSDQTDIALGRLRAYRDARNEYLKRSADTDTDQEANDA